MEYLIRGLQGEGILWRKEACTEKAFCGEGIYI